MHEQQAIVVTATVSSRLPCPAATSGIWWGAVLLCRPAVLTSRHHPWPGWCPLSLKENPGDVTGSLSLVTRPLPSLRSNCHQFTTSPSHHQGVAVRDLTDPQILISHPQITDHRSSDTDGAAPLPSLRVSRPLVLIARC